MNCQHECACTGYPGKEGSLKEKLDWALEKARAKGLRRTRAQENVLRALIAADRPLSLAQLEMEPDLRETCDRVTMYRMTGRLEQAGLIRRLGFHERSMFFSMNWPHQHRDYLVCTECGTVEAVDMACPVEVLERQVSEATGYKAVYHELEFFGICPACQKK